MMEELDGYLSCRRRGWSVDRHFRGGFEQGLPGSPEADSGPVRSNTAVAQAIAYLPCPAAASMNAIPFGEPNPVTLSHPWVTVNEVSVPKLGRSSTAGPRAALPSISCRSYRDR